MGLDHSAAQARASVRWQVSGEAQLACRSILRSRRCRRGPPFLRPRLFACITRISGTQLQRKLSGVASASLRLSLVKGSQDEISSKKSSAFQAPQETYAVRPPARRNPPSARRHQMRARSAPRLRPLPPHRLPELEVVRVRSGLVHLALVNNDSRLTVCRDVVERGVDGEGGNGRKG